MKRREPVGNRTGERKLDRVSVRVRARIGEVAVSLGGGCR